MPESDVHSPQLTGEEIELIIELVDREGKQLLIETRHTDSRQLRSELNKRLSLVQNILDHLGRHS
ncbi:MAG: hypothetical protein IT161_01190 [Bryobacterales bacterium]|nr:hypothetical protein [Bryobacterales bacterium]